VDLRRSRLAGLVTVDLVASLALSACDGDSSACGGQESHPYLRNSGGHPAGYPYSIRIWESGEANQDRRMPAEERKPSA
jgi:hypothetical protein